MCKTCVPSLHAACTRSRWRRHPALQEPNSLDLWTKTLRNCNSFLLLTRQHNSSLGAASTGSEPSELCLLPLEQKGIPRSFSSTFSGHESPTLFIPSYSIDSSVSCESFLHGNDSLKRSSTLTGCATQTLSKSQYIQDNQINQSKHVFLLLFWKDRMLSDVSTRPLIQSVTSRSQQEVLHWNIVQPAALAAVKPHTNYTPTMMLHGWISKVRSYSIYPACLLNTGTVSIVHKQGWTEHSRLLTV